MSERELLRRTAELAGDFLDTLDERSVWPPVSVEELRETLGGQLPDGPTDPVAVVERLADLIERTCARARQFAAEIEAVPGCEVLNEVVLNQVLFRFPDDGTTSDVLARVQASGEAWMSGTVWGERAAIRLSVSNWRTSEDDISRTVEAFRRAAPAPAIA